MQKLYLVGEMEIIHIFSVLLFGWIDVSTRAKVQLSSSISFLSFFVMFLLKISQSKRTKFFEIYHCHKLC